MTRSRPTMSAKRSSRSATSSGMLDVVGGRAQHAGDQDLVVRQLRVAKHRPLVRMARIGGLEQQRLGLGLEQHRQQVAHRHVVVMRPFVVAPAAMHAHARTPAHCAARGSAPRRAARRAPGIRPTLALRYMVCRPMPRSGASICTRNPAATMRLVFDAQRLGHGLEVFVGRLVEVVGLEQRDHAGRGGIEEGIRRLAGGDAAPRNCAGPPAAAPGSWCGSRRRSAAGGISPWSRASRVSRAVAGTRPGPGRVRAACRRRTP